ncbi:hypothetical protein ACI1US_00940 [Leucobacter sp. BZR 635]
MREASPRPQQPAVWPIILCIAVTAIAGAVLVLLPPWLLGGADPKLWGAAAGLAILVIGFGALGIRLRAALGTGR